MSFRLVIAQLASLFAAVLLTLVTLDKGSQPITLWLLPLFAALAPMMLRSSHIGPQLIARMAWTAVIILVLPWVAFGGANELLAVAMVACGVALVVAGGHGLRESTGFRPARFRRTILVSIVIFGNVALWTLAFFGSAVEKALDGDFHAFTVMGTKIALLGLAALGMARLRVWGFVLAGLLGGALAVFLGAVALSPITTGGQTMMVASLSGLFFIPFVAAACVLVACGVGVRRSR